MPIPFITEKYTYSDYEDGKYVKKQGWHFASWVIVTCWILLISIALNSLVVGIVQLTKYVARTNCNKWERATHVQTEYVNYGFWDGECFATLPDGTRITTDKFIFNKGN